MAAISVEGGGGSSNWSGNHLGRVKIRWLVEGSSLVEVLQELLGLGGLKVWGIMQELL